MGIRKFLIQPKFLESLKIQNLQLRTVLLLTQLFTPKLIL